VAPHRPSATDFFFNSPADKKVAYFIDNLSLVKK